MPTRPATSGSSSECDDEILAGVVPFHHQGQFRSGRSGSHGVDHRRGGADRFPVQFDDHIAGAQDAVCGGSFDDLQDPGAAAGDRDLKPYRPGGRGHRPALVEDLPLGAAVLLGVDAPREHVLVRHDVAVVPEGRHRVVRALRRLRATVAIRYRPLRSSTGTQLMVMSSLISIASPGVITTYVGGRAPSRRRR